MSTHDTRNHETRTGIEITLHTGIRRTDTGGARCWFAEADGYQNVVGETPKEALSLVEEQIEAESESTSSSGESLRSVSALFADDDDNPFAIAPPDDSPAEADLLRHVVDHLTVTVIESINESLTVQGGDLRSPIRLTIRETYKRRGFDHNHSPAELRNRQDPTPEDFPDTLEDIITDPEQYVEIPDSLAVESMKDSAVRLIQLLSEAEDWESAASTTESERHQRHRRHCDTTSEVNQ